MSPAISAPPQSSQRKPRYVFDVQPGARYDLDYPKVTAHLNCLLDEGKYEEFYDWLRKFSRTSLFFFAYYILGLRGLNHPWLVARVREVQAEHDNTLDLWFREAWKSTLLSYALPIWEITQDPETTICIFSHTRSIAKGFLRRIKTTLETNKLLSLTWPDIFYANPAAESKKWSEDEGLIVRRKGVYAESTVEAWGVVDAQPTSKHFAVRDYDDVVTPESVTTVDQIEKTKDRYELSHNLGRRGGTMRVIGTRYAKGDLYGTLIDQEQLKVRKYSATGPDGQPVLHTPEQLAAKRATMSSWIYSCQMDQEPMAKSDQVFQRGWFPIVEACPTTLVDEIRYWDRAGTDARKARPGGSWTVGVRLAKSRQGQYFIRDVVRKQLSPLGVEELLANTASQDGPRVRIGIEQDPGQAGKAEAERQVRLLAGYQARVNAVHESKGVRAKPFAAQCEAGNVFLVRAPWNETYLRELEDFDGSEGCMADQVDASSGAFLLLTKPSRAGAFSW